MRELKNREVKGRRRLASCSQSHLLLADMDSGVLSFAPSDTPDSARMRRRRALNLELPADEYIMRAERQTTTMAEVERDIDVELTLAVGNTNWRKMEAAALTCDSTSLSSSSTESAGGLRLSSGHEWGLHHQMDDASFGYQSGVKNGFFEVEEGTGEEGGVKPSPRWFLECLSLKMA